MAYFSCVIFRPYPPFCIDCVKNYYIVLIKFTRDVTSRESLYDSDDDSTSKEEDESSIDESFEAINAWRLTTLECMV